MQRVGVTGATGFLGSALVDRLRDRPGTAITALTRTIRSSRVADSVTWVRGDLTSPVDTAAFVRDLDVVVHLAGSSSPLTSNAHLQSDVLGNLLPTLSLIQAIRQRERPLHVVFASSGGAVYAAPPRLEAVSEDAPTAPTSSYGIQKLASEEYFRMAADHGWLTATVLRIGNPYGVLLPAERLQGFIGVAVNRLAQGEQVRLFGDTRNVRDYVHLDDMTNLFERVLHPGEPFSIYNVGSGEGHSVDDILSTMETILGRDIPVERSAVAGEPRDLPPWIVLDAGKARRELDWKPSVGFAEGLERLLADAGVLE
jgi:UDP-glucose 4-epimerase